MNKTNVNVSEICTCVILDRQRERDLIFTNYVDVWLQFIKIFLQILSAVCINVVMVLLCKRELKFC